jgi:hypothetical protein
VFHSEMFKLQSEYNALPGCHSAAAWCWGVTSGVRQRCHLRHTNERNEEFEDGHVASNFVNDD